MWYHKKFKLQYDTNVFNEIIEYAERATWRQGYDQNGLLWNVEELPLNPKQFPILNELYEVHEYCACTCVRMCTHTF